MRFFVGLHQPSDCKRMTSDAVFISVNRLRQRKAPMVVGDWIMDSGAFTEISTHGRYRHHVSEYAADIRQWASNGRLLAAVAQDWMCEDQILKRAAVAEGLMPAPAGFRHDDPHAFKSLVKVPWPRAAQAAEQLAAHQRRTIERYDELRREDTAGVYILPVLQGFAPRDYVKHVRMYGTRLAHGAWVGVGSVCKRNGDPDAILAVLRAIKDERPDLKLHGFGLKTTALQSYEIRGLLETADSMSWSLAARKQGRNANDWREAKRFYDLIESFDW